MEIRTPGIWLISVAVVLLVGCKPDIDSVPSGLTPCFVLPGVWSQSTQAYRLTEAGGLERTSTVEAPGYHMRAAQHPNRRWLYVTGVGADDNQLEGVALHQFEWQRRCEIGELRTTVNPGGEDPSNERAYGLVVHPSGRWAYQTTASLGEIRVFEIDPESGNPSLAFTQPVLADSDSPPCLQVRRLAQSRDGRTLYSNCNNGEADYALHAWRVAEDGGLSLLQAVTLEGMNAGIFDPVIHPNGEVLYQLASSSRSEFGDGAGAYLLVFDVDSSGVLSFNTRVPIRTIAEGDRPDALVYPVTLSITQDGSIGFVTVHAGLASMPGRHELVEVSLDAGGRRPHVRRRVPAALELEYSSHHGAELIGRGTEQHLVSFLTDYDTIRGGILQHFRVSEGARLVPADPPWIATGLGDARQPIRMRER